MGVQDVISKENMGNCDCIQAPTSREEPTFNTKSFLPSFTIQFSPKFISPKQYSQVMGQSPSAIARELKKGLIPYEKRGRRILIPWSFIEQLEHDAMGSYATIRERRATL